MTPQKVSLCINEQKKKKKNFFFFRNILFLTWKILDFENQLNFRIFGRNRLTGGEGSINLGSKFLKNQEFSKSKKKYFRKKYFFFFFFFLFLWNIN